MAVCVESHYISSGIAGNSLKVDGLGYSDPTYGFGTLAFLPSHTQTEADCTGYLLQTAAEVTAQAANITSLTLETIGIDPAQIFYVYTWGAGAVLFMWKFGYAIGSAIDAIRKA